MKGRPRKIQWILLASSLAIVSCTQGPELPPRDDPRISEVKAWLDDHSFCAEDPDCHFDEARRIIAESEAEGLYTVPEILIRLARLSGREAP